MSLKSTIRLATVSILMASCGSNTQESKVNEAPNSANRPQIMGVAPKKLDQIPSTGRLDHKPWSDSYWPTYQGGISYRWQNNSVNSNNYEDYLFDTYNTREIERLSLQEINELSPAEKYDLWLGNTEFPLTNHEQQRMRSSVQNGSVATWMGLCHGWAAAAYMEEQPGAIARVKTNNGKTIEFYSSDIKALVTKVYADAKLPTYFIGGRCNDNKIERDSNGRAVDASCRDTNPATFHQVLGEYIGVKKQSFIMDVTNSAEVWNQPVLGYSFTYSNKRTLSSDRNYRNAAPNTVTLIDVNAKVDYIVELNQSAQPVNAGVKQTNLKYTLELDDANVVVGGEWISTNHPDFLWTPKAKPENFVANTALSYKKVKELLDMSLGSISQPTQPTQPTQPVPQLMEKIVRCESIDFKDQKCAINEGRIVNAVVQKQLSNKKCVKNISWNHTQDAILVNNGCRAEFKVTIQTN